jgi:hypothetical protein
MSESAEPRRQKPIRIPLDFQTAVRGLLKVDPKQLKKRVARKKAAKKVARKKG